MQRSLEPTAPLTSDWAVAPSGEHDAQIGAVDNAVVVQVTNARGAGADAPRCKFDAQVSAVDHAVVIEVGDSHWCCRIANGAITIDARRKDVTGPARVRLPCQDAASSARTG